MQLSLSASLASLCTICKHNYLVQYLDIISKPAESLSVQKQGGNQSDAGHSCPDAKDAEHNRKQTDMEPSQHKPNQIVCGLQDALDYIKQGSADLATAYSRSALSLCSACELRLNEDKSAGSFANSSSCVLNQSTGPMYVNTTSQEVPSKPHLQSIRTTSNDSGNGTDIDSPVNNCTTTDQANDDISLSQTEYEFYCNAPTSLTTVHGKPKLSDTQTEYETRCSTPGSTISASTAGYLKFDQWSLHIHSHGHAHTTFVIIVLKLVIKAFSSHNHAHTISFTFLAPWWYICT